MKSILRTFLSFSLVLTFALLLNTSNASAQNRASQTNQEVKGKTVVKVVNSDNDTSIFSVLLKKSGFEQVLKQKGPYTVLAPDNEILRKRLKISKLENNPKKLKSVVQNNLYKGRLSKKKIEAALGVKVIESHTASNGVVYVINSLVKNS